MIPRGGQVTCHGREAKAARLKSNTSGKLPWPIDPQAPRGPEFGPSGSALLLGFAACFGRPKLGASELRETPIVKAVQRVRARWSISAVRRRSPPPRRSGRRRRTTSRRVNGMGTGVVIDPRGYIVTNHHVVDGVHEILVTMADGQRYVAKLVARDMETDLADHQDRRRRTACPSCRSAPPPI